MKRISVLVALAFSTLLYGCVTSKTPLLGADSRVLPFLPNTQFEVYERDNARAPWTKNSTVASFAADASLVIRELDGTGKPKEDTSYTVHPLGPGRFLVQAQFSRDGRYAYAALAIRDGEGTVTGLSCKVIDQAAFRRDGGTVSADYCELDSARDPLGLLRKLAEGTGPQMRYVPVKK